MHHKRTTSWDRRGGIIAVAAAVVTAALVSASAGTAKPNKSSYSIKNLPYTALAKYMYGKDWAKYVGKNGQKKTKANPKLAPIYLGWLNTDDGINSRQYITPIADMTTWAINNVLGGIQGHRVVLKKCSMHSNESDGQVCGQQFANDQQIKAVAVGVDIAGGTTFQKAMNGAKPIVVGVSTGPYDLNAPNTWAIEASRYVSGIVIKNFVDNGKKKIAYVTGNNPLLVAVYNQLKAQVEAAGINANMTPVYYDPTATDITPTVIAANLKSYDAIYFVSPSAALCTPVIKALNQQGITDNPNITTVVNTACFSPDVIKAVGDLPKWNYFFYGPLIYAPYKKTSEVASYIQMARDTKSVTAINAEPASGPIAASEIMYLARIFDQLGYKNLTQAKIINALNTAKFGVFMGPPRENFGAYPSIAKNIGAIGFYQYHYLGKGKYTPAYNGKWLDWVHK